MFVTSLLLRGTVRASRCVLPVCVRVPASDDVAVNPRRNGQEKFVALPHSHPPLPALGQADPTHPSILFSMLFHRQIEKRSP
jgi:hypothetical protein